MSARSPGPGKSFPTRALLGGLALAIVATAAFIVDLRGFLVSLVDRIDQLGIWGPILFIVAYVAATVMMVPGSILTLGAGRPFGLTWGSLYVSVGATLGAGAAFLIGRHLARDWIAGRVRGNPRFAAIDRAVESEGWKIVGLTRLSPVFPFNLLNYAFGLTKIRFSHYLVASWIGMTPGMIVYVYLGSFAKTAASSGDKAPLQWLLYAVGLVATIAVTVVVTRMAHRALSRRAPIEGTPL